MCTKTRFDKEAQSNSLFPHSLRSRAKAPPAKRSEKGYGDENGEIPH